LGVKVKKWRGGGLPVDRADPAVARRAMVNKSSKMGMGWGIFPQIFADWRRWGWEWGIFPQIFADWRRYLEFEQEVGRRREGPFLR